MDTVLRVSDLTPMQKGYKILVPVVYVGLAISVFVTYLHRKDILEAIDAGRIACDTVTCTVPGDIMGTLTLLSFKEMLMKAFMVPLAIAAFYQREANAASVLLAFILLLVAVV